jgi:carbonic anhydrase
MLGALLLLGAGLALANEPAHGAAEHGAKAEPAAAASAEAKAKAATAKANQPPLHAAAASAPAKAAAPESDSLAVLKGKLEEKLGATNAPNASANVLRVASKGPTPSGEMVLRSGDAHGGGGEAARPAVVRRKVAKAEPAAAEHAAAGHAAHWDYKGTAGPEAWGAMKPEFSTCAVGTRQSPIDIRDGLKVQLDPVQFDYRASGFSVIDNGHTIQVNLQPGNSIEVAGRRFDLLQFHFHRPSEERINGKQFDMVAHLVHKDAEGRLAVVAVLLDRGAAQPLIQQVWNNLPLEKNEAVAARVSIDMNALLPAERSYFTYMGSLTTPPCSEGVLWMVMKNPVGISNDQISLFSRLYPMNARPIQQVAGRMIKESN